MNETVVRWGIVGMGRFGAVHARAIAGLHGSRVVAVCSRDDERRGRAVQQFAARGFADYRQLLADPEIDVVSICTHWLDHYEIAVAALQSGKHVMLEKPMASTREECLAIVNAARQTESYLMVGHICRFDPRSALAKEAIDAGRIGRIVSMHAKRNLPKAPGWLRLDKTSPLMGDGVHDADLMMWMIDRPPSRIYAKNVRVNEFTYPDIGWAMLEFDDQAIGVVETNWCLPENAPTVIDARMEVVGERGSLTIDCSHTGLNILDEQGMKMADTDYWPAIHGRQTGVLSDELSYFADCIRLAQPPTVVTPSDAARAALVMLTAESSAQAGAPIDYADPAELT